MAIQNTNIFSTPNNERTIDSFKSRLLQGGARSNLFEVELNFPSGLGIFDDERQDTSFRMMVKGAQLPASNIPEVIVPFRGRQLKVAGDRRFDPWTITVINDGDFKLRQAFERWANYIIKVSDGSGTTNPADYFQDWIVTQLGRAPTNLDTPGSENGSSIPVQRAYKFYGCWPSNVSAINLSYDEQDQIEEFQVTLQVQWWEAYTGNNENSVV